jgi:ketosteroid isomerase-like protein|tara:strand:- start:6055 stop:6981 length:927 start_codon:yes stop_codon:yes gene_type:complete
MKKLLLSLALLFTAFTFAQKKNLNGKIYDKHPAINVVESFTKAFVEGNQEELKALVSDDFKWWQMNAMMPKPLTIENLIGRSEYFVNNVIGFSVTNRGTAYSDALEFGKNGVNVYAYQVLKGFDKNTGYKLQIPRNSIFFFDKDGKISGLSVSDSQLKWEKAYDAWGTSKNGVLYKDHPMISKARLLYAYLELGDLTSIKELYAEDAKIFDVMNSDINSFVSVEEEMNNLKEFYKTYEISNVSERGYPDLLDYEGDDTSTIISWWNVTVKNKKSGNTKETVHHSQIVVNSDGKIITEQYYFNASALPN